MCIALELVSNCNIPTQLCQQRFHMGWDFHIKDSFHLLNNINSLLFKKKYFWLAASLCIFMSDVRWNNSTRASQLPTRTSRLQMPGKEGAWTWQSPLTTSGFTDREETGVTKSKGKCWEPLHFVMMLYFYNSNFWWNDCCPPLHCPSALQSLCFTHHHFMQLSSLKGLTEQPRRSAREPRGYRLRYPTVPPAAAANCANGEAN